MARKKGGTRTNIETWHRSSFKQLASNRGQFALFSCYVNGEPTAAIVSVERHPGGFDVRPLFVAVTPGMNITDHDGVPVQLLP